MDGMPAFLEAFSKHQSYRLRWGELSEVQIPLKRTSLVADAYEHNPGNNSLYVSPRIMAGLRSYGDFWHATRSEKLVNLW